MNTLKKLPTVASVLFTFRVANAQEDGLISVQLLPTNAQTFINQSLSANNIVPIWQDNEEGRVKDYTVPFADGAKVEFRVNDGRKRVKAHNEAVPAKTIPAKIGKYVHENHLNVPIRKIQKERRKYKISLSNGLDLDLNLNGEFLKIDG